MRLTLQISLRETLLRRQGEVAGFPALHSSRSTGAQELISAVSIVAVQRKVQPYLGQGYSFPAPR